MSLATQVHMGQTVNNIEIFNYVINIFVLIENKCNNRKSWRWLKRHAGGGRETMIQFVVALLLMQIQTIIMDFMFSQAVASLGTCTYINWV